jgi:hypothetical protein
MMHNGNVLGKMNKKLDLARRRKTYLEWVVDQHLHLSSQVAGDNKKRRARAIMCSRGAEEIRRASP